MSDRLPPLPYRWGLLVVALAQLPATTQALLAPRAFYDEFPFGRGWVAAYPEFNEHLVRDYGAFTLGALTALVIAAIWLDRRVVQVAVAAWLVGATIHLASHVATVERFETADAVANLGALLAFVALPGWLLLKSRERRTADAPAEARGSA